MFHGVKFHEIFRGVGGEKIFLKNPLGISAFLGILVWEKIFLGLKTKKQNGLEKSLGFWVWKSESKKKKQNRQEKISPTSLTQEEVNV